MTSDIRRLYPLVKIERNGGVFDALVFRCPQSTTRTIKIPILAAVELTPEVIRLGRAAAEAWDKSSRELK